MGMAPRWSGAEQQGGSARLHGLLLAHGPELLGRLGLDVDLVQRQPQRRGDALAHGRSEEHTSELQSPCNLVCRLLLEKKKNTLTIIILDIYRPLRPWHHHVGSHLTPA